MLGAYAALYFFAGGSAPDDKTIATLPHNIWYSIGMSSNATLRAAERSALVTLISNFGTFIAYGLTNIVCIVAYREHHEFHGLKHMVIPVFGALRTGCMLFYVIGPIEGLGSAKEPLMAVGFALFGVSTALSILPAIRKRRARARSWYKSRLEQNWRVVV